MKITTPIERIILKACTYFSIRFQNKIQVLTLSNSIYLITFLFSLYILFIWLAPLKILIDLSFGNIKLDLKAVNLGEFGSFLSGIFSPLAFLWLLLTFKQTDKNLQIARKELKILEEKEFLRKKLIKPILYDLNLQSMSNYTLRDDWHNFSIHLSVNGSLERIMFEIHSSNDKLNINNDYLTNYPRLRKPCFPLYKSFKDESINFICSFNLSKIIENEVLELRLCYLDIDGNDYTTSIYFKYTPVFRTDENNVRILVKGDMNSFKLSFNNNWE